MDVQKTLPLHRSHSGLNFQPDLTTLGFDTPTSSHSSFVSLHTQTHFPNTNVSVVLAVPWQAGAWGSALASQSN